MKVHIVNNGGAGWDTQITDADTGQTLDFNIVQVVINAVDATPYVELTSTLPRFDIVGEATVRHICPCCGTEIDLSVARSAYTPPAGTP